MFDEPLIEQHYRIFENLLRTDGFDNNATKNAFFDLRIAYRVSIDSVVIYHHSNISYGNKRKLISQWMEMLSALEEQYGVQMLDELKTYCSLKEQTDYQVDIEGIVDDIIDLKTGARLDQFLINVILNKESDRLLFSEMMRGLRLIITTKGLWDVKYQIVKRIEFEYDRLGLYHTQLAMLLSLYQAVTDNNAEELAETIVTDVCFTALACGDYETLNAFIGPVTLLKNTETPYVVVRDVRDNTYHTVFCDSGNMMERLFCLVSYLSAIRYDSDELMEYIKAAEKLIDLNVIGTNGRPIGDNPNVNRYRVTIYNKMGHLLINRGEYSEAEKYFRLAIKYTESSKKYDRTLSLLFLANVLNYQNKFNESEEIAKEVLKYNETNYLPPETITDLWGLLASNAIGLKRYEEAQKRAEFLLSFMRGDFIHKAFELTAQERANLWERDYNSLLSGFTYTDSFNRANAVNAFDAALFQKGVLLNFNKVIEKNVLSSNDAELKAAFLNFKKSGGRFDENLFMRLYSTHIEFSENYPFFTWQDVQQRLSSHDVAIEFTVYDSSPGNGQYAAIVLRKVGTPILVDLCREKDISDLFDAGAKIYGKFNNQAYGMIWGNIEPYLKGAQNVYFSPTELLSFINIEVLCDEKGKAINQQYNVFRMSSTASLCSEDSQNTYSSALLFGGLDYEIDTSQMRVISQSIHHETDTPSRFPFMVGNGICKPLPATMEEVLCIKSILEGKKFGDVVLCMGKNGTEEMFKSISGHSPSVIHLATHGFYINDRQYSRLQSEADTSRWLYNPLMRCGLALSGAKHICIGESIPNDIEDGILTGEEIAGLDLTGTNLLILSACQTGLGEVHGDGIYGLQHGFKAAGVGTIIMSLWEVDDEATSIMMQSFYRNLVKGKNKRESFYSAQKEVKKWAEKKEIVSPEYYWAAFIMLD